MFKTMGRLLLLALIILAVILMWKAFGPGSAQRYGSQRGLQEPQKPVIKGPDDDEEFLWNIEKNGSRSAAPAKKPNANAARTRNAAGAAVNWTRGGFANSSPPGNFLGFGRRNISLPPGRFLRSRK